MKIKLFIPCFVDQLYPQVAVSMVKVLRKLGCEIDYNPKQTCCGQPAFNAGFWEDSKDVCEKFIKDFEGTEPIVTPSASCAGFVRNYYKELYKDDANKLEKLQALSARIFEFTEFLVHQLKVTEIGAQLSATATYHDSCAALREIKIKQEPRLLLKHVGGLQLSEMQDVETCCGFGGTFAVKFQAISGAMADQKVTNAVATNAQILISTDVSCIMHIDGYARKKNQPLKCMHIAEVLASGW